MLEIQVAEEWKAYEPEALARAVLDGDLVRSTQARNRSQRRGEGPLDELLDPTHFEAISRELLDRLHTLYLQGTHALETTPLRQRLENLLDWGWDDPVIRGRVLWVAAWIEELTGSWQSAVHLYGLFLDQPEPEPLLRLLAYNNRGVLRCRFGRPGGVLDLGRAAFSLDFQTETARLPAACFNLLNLVNAAFRSESLRVQVDRALVEVLVRLPPAMRRQWIGPDPLPERDDTLPSFARDDIADDPSAPPEADATKRSIERLREKLTILSPTSIERLNYFTSQLAIAAREMAPEPRPDRRDLRAYRDWMLAQLFLWRPIPQATVAGDTRLGERFDTRTTARLFEVAGAASLLYANQIPSSLRPQEGEINWLERKLREVLRRVAKHLEKNEFGIAEKFLRSVIAEAPEDSPDPRVRLLRYRAIEELENVRAQEESQREHEIHARWERLSKAVDEICAERDLYRARQRWGDLTSEYEWLRNELETRSGGHPDRLLRDLVATVEEHLEDLERRELEGRLHALRARFFELRPTSWSTPVAMECYRALEECRLQDPNNIVQDWDTLETELRAHDARHYFERAIATLCGSPSEGDTQPVEEVLAIALENDPSLAAACAPILGLARLSSLRESPESARKIRDALVGAARTLVETVPLGGEESDASLRSDRAQRAATILRRLLEEVAAVEPRDRFATLLDSLAEGFKQALAEAEPERIEEIEVMITSSLDAAPEVHGGRASRSDPRNPLSFLLEDCLRLRTLGLAERALNEKEPRLDDAAELFREALEGRLRSSAQLERAVLGYYLSALGRHDSPEEQRRILDQLEEWLGELDEELVCAIGPEHVEEKVEDLRLPEEEWLEEIDSGEEETVEGSSVTLLERSAEDVPSDAPPPANDPAEGSTVSQDAPHDRGRVDASPLGSSSGPEDLDGREDEEEERADRVDPRGARGRESSSNAREDSRE